MNEDHPYHPEITSISIEGFKSIERIQDLPLRPINVLIGANGSGKSNFIGAFSLLQAVRDDTVDEYVERSGGADRILHFGSKVSRAVQVGVRFHGSGNRFELRLEAAEADRLVVTSNVSLGDRMMIREGRIGMSQFLRHQLQRFRVYHFHDTILTSPMKRTADLHDNRYLREDGSNLAALLYRLWHKEQASYDMIVRTVRLVAPFFDDFVLEPQALNEDKIRLEWRHRGSDAYFDTSSLSDGALRFMAPATLLLRPADLQPLGHSSGRARIGPASVRDHHLLFARETVLRAQADRHRYPVADRGRPLRAGGCTRSRSRRWSNRAQTP